MIKIAFLNPTIPPRVISLLNKISQDKTITLQAFFFAESQKNRNWNLNSQEYQKINFEYSILQSFSFGFGVKDYHNSFFSLDIWKKLSAFDPDVVLLPGWADLTSLLAFLWAKTKGKKVVLRTESTVNEQSLRRVLFMPYIKFLCKRVDLIIGSSNRASDFAKKLMPTTKVITIHSSLDTLEFVKKIKKVQTTKQQLRKMLGIQQQKVFYFNGQSIERKGLLPLIDVFSKEKNQDKALLLTGKGMLDPVLTQSAKKVSNIYPLGYQRQTDLAKYYAVSDFFILPSYEETWGVVTVEAMAAGLPILISDKAGSSELISDGKNGFVIKKVDAQNIQKAVVNASQLSATTYKKMSKLNTQTATTVLSYEHISIQFSKAFKSLFS